MSTQEKKPGEGVDAEEETSAERGSEREREGERGSEGKGDGKSASSGFDWRGLITLPQKIGWRDQVIGFGLAATYVIWLLATARNLGFARDEGFYFRAAQDYAHWYQLLFTHPAQAVQRAAIDGPWSNNHEHPALMKTLFGFSWTYLYQRWHLFHDASTSFRFPAMCTAGMTLWITYLFGARTWSRRSGFMAASLLALMPRVFYHSHLACFDVPIMAMWTACIYVYWRSLQEGGLGWAIASGVMYGLTLETKHNAWILPAVFVPHAIVAMWKPISREVKVGRLPLPTSLIAMATIGPLVFYAFWPWLWNDTFARLDAYVSFHMNHVYYNIEYLHKNYFSAPSPTSYAPVMIAATVPTVTLVLFAVGAFDRLRALTLRFFDFVRGKRGDAPRPPRDRAESDLLFFLAMSSAIAVFFLPKTPIFGGTKHWMPAYPFLALFAGRGFELCADKMKDAVVWLKTAQQRVAAQIALAALIITPPLAITIHSHPFGLSSYVPFVGGTAGGADLGLNRQFWGFTTQSLEPYFARSAPPHARVFIHDTAWDSWNRLIQEDRVRPDLQAVGSPSEAQIAIVHLEKHMRGVAYQIWVVFGTDKPDYVLTHDGVPIITVYKR